MAGYKLSAVAKIDISNLYEYGILHFGLLQAQNYVLEMHDHFKKLSENSYLGRDASEFKKGLLRLTFRSHIIFYQSLNKDVFIVRVLPQRANLEQHF